MWSRKSTTRAVLLSLALGLAVGVIGAAAAETGSWPVPPQNSFEACVGRGSPSDIGAPLQVQVNDRYGPYRGDQVVMVSDVNGGPVVTLACNGPADQFRLPPDPIGLWPLSPARSEVRKSWLTCRPPAPPSLSRCTTNPINPSTRRTSTENLAVWDAGAAYFAAGDWAEILIGKTEHPGL